MLQLAASTPVSTRRGASKKSTSKTGTVTRKTKTVTRGDTKPKGAKYPPVLARLLAAAQDPAKLQMLAEVQAEGTAVVPYPEALAAYLDLADLTGVPPTVAPPKRAAYPVVLAEALGLGLGKQSADDLTSQLLAEAEESEGDVDVGGSTMAAYPSALADVLELSERGGAAAAAPVQAVYPAALAQILGLSASGPTQEAPQAYPEALAQLHLDLVEALAAGAEPEQKTDASTQTDSQDKGAGAFDLFARFDKIAQDFAKKFGV